MTMRASVVAGTVALVLGLVAACPAQQPKVSNAQVREGSGLSQEIAAAKSAEWIGYAIATTHTVQTNWDDGMAYLEGRHDSGKTIYERKPGEPAPQAAVLLRVEAGKVEHIRMEELSREIDGGGLPFVWVNGVPASESLRVLNAALEVAAKAIPVVKERGAMPGSSEFRDQISTQVRREISFDTAMSTIALHDAAEATGILRGYTAPAYAEKVREKAAFWLANDRGREGFLAVKELLHNDKDEALREKLVFDLTLVKGESKAAALDELIAVAKSDAEPKVQKQAQFWLAQQAARKLHDDPRIAATLSESAKNDPEMAIRRSAVFALSRMPEEQGVPELIKVASTSKDYATRREALTWLGRSKDPRALEYLEKVAKE